MMTHDDVVNVTVRRSTVKIFSDIREGEKEEIPPEGLRKESQVIDF